MSRQHAGREDGASMVEVGLVLPLLILLAIGLSEIGFLVIDYLTATNAARSGARTVAAAGISPTADDIALDVIEEAMCNLRFSNLKSVSIFAAEVDGSKPVVGSPLKINTWVNTGPLSSLDCDNAGHTLSQVSAGWSSTSRDMVLPGLDSIGVEVVFSHESVTGIFPFPTVNWTETAVMQIEPDTRGAG